MSIESLRLILSDFDADTVGRLNLVIAAIALVIAVASAYYARIPIKEALRLRRDPSRSGAFVGLSFEDCSRSLKYYVEPDGCSIDPATEDDFLSLIPSRQPIYELLDQIFRTHSKYRHLIVLADSGMGKTSLLYNIMWRNSKLATQQQLSFAYVPLGHRDSLFTLAELSVERSRTILLLDAFDEDPLAINDVRNRLSFILQQCQDFKRVVVTCRTQFFSDEKQIPRKSGIVNLGPRGGGDSGELGLYKIYLAPLSSGQVDAWINLRFHWYEFAKKRAAKKIILSIPELTVRPMLLVVVPDLINDRYVIDSACDLYAYMILKWLQRESRWIRPKVLLEFSRQIAVEIFCGRAKRGSEIITRAEVRQLLIETHPNDAWKFESRSLLNRDADGNLKFAHRSILEYLFVEAMLLGDKRCLEVDWTDQMIRFLWEALWLWASNDGKRVLPAPIAVKSQGLSDTRIADRDLIHQGKLLGVLHDWRELLSFPLNTRCYDYIEIFVRVFSFDQICMLCDHFKGAVTIFSSGSVAAVLEGLWPIIQYSHREETPLGIESAWIAANPSAYLANISEVLNLLLLSDLRESVLALRSLDTKGEKGSRSKSDCKLLCVDDSRVPTLLEIDSTIAGVASTTSLGYFEWSALPLEISSSLRDAISVFSFSLPRDQITGLVSRAESAGLRVLLNSAGKAAQKVS